MKRRHSILAHFNDDEIAAIRRLADKAKIDPAAMVLRLTVEAINARKSTRIVCKGPFRSQEEVQADWDAVDRDYSPKLPKPMVTKGGTLQSTPEPAEPTPAQQQAIMSLVNYGSMTLAEAERAIMKDAR